MSDLFGGLDVADAPEVGLNDGVYNGVLKNLERKNSKAGAPYLVFTYEVKGQSIQDWQALPPEGNPQTWDDSVTDAKGLTEKERALRSLGYIKARLSSLGVPPERMNGITADDLRGLEVVVTVKKNNSGFPSITNVGRPGDSGATLPTPTAGAAVTTPATTAPAPSTIAASGPVDNPFAAG